MPPISAPPAVTRAFMNILTSQREAWIDAALHAALAHRNRGRPQLLCTQLPRIRAGSHLRAVG